MLLEVDQGSRLFAKASQSISEMNLAVGTLGADRRAFTYRKFRWQILLDRHNVVHFVVACLVDDPEAAVP